MTKEAVAAALLQKTHVPKTQWVEIAGGQAISGVGTIGAIDKARASCADHER